MTNEVPEQPAVTNVRCAACRSEIPIGATICHVCKSWQSRWKSSLAYLAATAGIITIFISLVTYVVSTAPSIRKTLFYKDDVQIAEFNSSRAVVVQNYGDGDVFVSHIYIESERPRFARAIYIERSVSSKTFLVHNFSEKERDTTGWTTGHRLTEAHWERVLSFRKGDEKCIKWAIYHPNDPHFQNMKKFLKESFRTINIKGSLVFFSGYNGKQLHRELELRGVPFLRADKSCEATLWTSN